MSDINRHTIRAFGLLIMFFTMLAVWPILLYAQDAAQAAAETATPTTGTSELTASLMWAFLSSSALEWLKRNQSIKIAILQEDTPFKIQRILGFLAAFATALGITWSFDANEGKLVISGLMIDGIIPALINTLRQWVFQEVAYRISVKNYRPQNT